MRALIDRIAPVIGSRVTRVARHGRRTSDEVRQIGEELTSRPREGEYGVVAPSLIVSNTTASST